MDPLTTVGLIGAIGGPLSGITIAVIADRRSKKSGEANSDVALRAVEVDEKDAHTREIAVMIEGFTASLSNLRTDLEATRERLATAEDELGQTRGEVGELRKRIEKGDRERDELVAHIIELEKMVPYPPGPPTRPIWIRHQS